uniref:Mitochondrial transcription termination factor family protein n=1 Tax=Davidia involucrata TaxID=16924 RepID=A0A5B6YXP1_DAVIN
MLGKSLASPLLTFDPATRLCFSSPDLAKAAPNSALVNGNFINGSLPNVIREGWTSIFAAKKWEIRSTTQAESLGLSDEDRKTWEACRQALSAFKFSIEEEDKILGKAFGQVHSPYWGEERKKEVPKVEIVNEILDYLRSLSLSDDDLCKLLKKFPEVLGCSLGDELRTNVQVLEKEWGIKGKSLRNLLLRNPKVLGYNIDCKGDCMAQCTRCWVRF